MADKGAGGAAALKADTGRGLGMRPCHRGGNAGLGGAFQENRVAGGRRRKPSGLCDRRVFGAVPGGAWARGFPFELFENDVPASADAGDFVGADLQELPYHKERALSQIRAKGNRSSGRKKRKFFIEKKWEGFWHAEF